MSNLAANIFYNFFSPRYNLTIHYTYYKQYKISYTKIYNKYLPLTISNQFKTLTQQPQPLQQLSNQQPLSFDTKYQMITFIINNFTS